MISSTGLGWFLVLSNAGHDHYLRTGRWHGGLSERTVTTTIQRTLTEYKNITKHYTKPLKEQDDNEEECGLVSPGCALNTTASSGDCYRSTPTCTFTCEGSERLSRRFNPPVNNRFRQWVTKNVPWEKILLDCDYEIVEKGPPTHKKMATKKPRPSGDEYYIHCAYHPERTASLHLVSYGFHCFGCGITGTKLEFVVDMKRIRTAHEVKQFFAPASELCKE